MLKLLTAGAVLYILSVTGAEVEYNVTKLEVENPFTLVVAQDIMNVSLTSEDGYLRTNSTNPSSNACDYGRNWNMNDVLNGIQAKILLGGQKLVIWGLWRQYAYESDSKSEHGYTTSHVLILANPWTCKYERLDGPYYEIQGNVPMPYGDIMVVTYADTFDVFAPGLKNCSPCRYDLEGKKVDLVDQLEFPSPDLVPYVIPKGMHIELMNVTDRKQGYFFSRNFENNTAVIEHLDEHFKTLKRLYVDHPVHSVSITGTIYNERRISVCYASHNVYPIVSPDHLEVHCRQFDSDFKPKLSIQIPVNENSFVSGMVDLAHQVDPLGNTYVGLIESSDRRTQKRPYYYDDIVESRQFRYFVYDKTGKLLESHDLEKANRFVNPRNRSRGLFALLLIGNKICFDNHDFISNSVYEIKSYHTSRCFDISSYKPPNF